MAIRRSAAADDLAGDVAALKKQLAQLAASIDATAKSEGGDAVRAIGDKARDFLAQASSFVDNFGRDMRDAAGETIHSAAARVKASAQENTERLEDAIRERPLTAMAIAVGVGCLLSMLLRRR
jgi:ElaB/YqjD/DUF883 family membrane-anchored ribosome-binding protein